MRSDLVNAYVMRNWLAEHQPEVAAHWDLPANPEAQRFAANMPNMFARIGDVLIGQAILAQAIIDVLELDNAVLLGGGTPTPLSPRHQHIAYYTDKNPEAIAEAEQAGYTTLQVDVLDAAAIAQLKDASTAVGTGLMHFMDDAQFVQVLNNLHAAGIDTFAFNHVDVTEVGEQPVMKKFVAQMYGRTQDEIAALLPEGWQIKDTWRMLEILSKVPEIGGHFAGLPNIYNVYLLTTA